MKLICLFSFLTLSHAIHANSMIINALDSLPVIDSVQTIAASCASPTGEIAIVARGNPLRYSIDSGRSFQNSALFKGLLPNRYVIQVCEGMECVTRLANVLKDSVLYIRNVSISDVSCATHAPGSVWAYASGRGRIQYKLLNETNSTGNFGNLGTGNYLLTISDTGCSNQRNLEIGTSSLNVSLSANVQNTTCGKDNGVVSIDVNGGRLFSDYPLRVHLLGPSSGIKTDFTFRGLKAGIYSAVAVGGSGCARWLNNIVVGETSHSLKLDSLQITAPTCNHADGKVKIVPQGSNPPFQYALDSSIFQNNNLFRNLAQGSYQFRVKDSIGCEGSVQVHLTNGDNSLKINLIEVEHARCDNTNGQLSVQATGGFGILKYATQNTLYQTESLFTQLRAGTYQVRVQDSTGCMAEKTVQVKSLSPKIQIDSVTVDTGCGYVGSIHLNVSGGTAPLFFVVNNNFTQTLPFFIQLPPNNYSIRVQDPFGCAATTSVTLPYVEPLPKPMVQQVGNTLISNLTEGNQWVNVNLEPIAGATQQVWEPPLDRQAVFHASFRRGKCVRFSDDFLFTPLGTRLQNIDNQVFKLKCYPNPATERVEIESTFPNDLSDPLWIELSDVTGRVVRKIPFATQLNFAVDDLQQGCYWICLKKKGVSLAMEQLYILAK